ncbi:DUF2993 domain-containing protein [Lacisediminihabitans sp. H27-G8]|uniref:LmeA family phospholipid-binding protein n=1 Tax=Lacisediminihabitans sp. H27-G8 TaxID=3111909 RepID=UPI0038FC5D01
MASQDGEQYDWNLGRSGREYPEDSAANEPDPFPFVETEIVRRRGRGWIGLGVFLVILVVIVVALDAGARWYAGNLIEAKARSSLSIADSTPVTVDIAGASVLYQAAIGKFERVDVAIAKLGVGDVSGKATLTATGVPLSQSKPLESARLAVVTSPEELKKLLAGFTTLPVTSVKIGSGAVQIGTSVTALGVTVPVAIAFVPKAVDGQLELTPKSLVVNGATVTPDGLRSTFGPLADPVLATQKICVARYLPKQLPLDSVIVKGSSLELAVAGKAVTLDRALLTTKGVCA